MYRVCIDNELLPVAPAEIEWSYNADNVEMQTAGEYNINVINNPKLAEISFKALLPAVKYGFARYDGEFKPPAYFFEKLRRIMEDKKSVIFEIVKTDYKGKYISDAYLSVTIEKLTVTESAENGLDLIASLRLKQSVEYGSIIVENNAEYKPRVTQKQTPAQSPKEYTVKKGDSLWAICKREYGDGSKYKEVAKDNGIANPSLIYPNQKIRLK